MWILQVTLKKNNYQFSENREKSKIKSLFIYLLGCLLRLHHRGFIRFAQKREGKKKKLFKNG